MGGREGEGIVKERRIVVIEKDNRMCTTYRDTECSGNCDGKLCSF